ncbi:MAG: hypothetical protein WCP92_04525 [bacterium]
MSKTKTNKAMFTAKTKIIDIHEGENLEVLINEQDAREEGITSMDKVSLVYDNKEFVFDVSLSSHLIQRGEVGIFEDIREKYKMKSGQFVTVSFTKNSSESLDALKK